MYSNILNIIKNFLPFSDPFLFVDKILFVNEKKIEGKFYFNKNFSFYNGHFKDKPLTPGTIQIETMGQYCVTHIIYNLIQNNENPNLYEYKGANVNFDFFKPIFPDTEVFVECNLLYKKLNVYKYDCFLKELISNELYSAGQISIILTNK